MPQASAICWTDVLSPEEANSLAAVSRISVLRAPSTDTTSTPWRVDLSATTVLNGEQVLAPAIAAPRQVGPHR
jgi:hypothetical protein